MPDLFRLSFGHTLKEIKAYAVKHCFIIIFIQLFELNITHDRSIGHFKTRSARKSKRICRNGKRYGSRVRRKACRSLGLRKVIIPPLKILYPYQSESIGLKIFLKYLSILVQVKLRTLKRLFYIILKHILKELRFTCLGSIYYGSQSVYLLLKFRKRKCLSVILCSNGKAVAVGIHLISGDLFLCKVICSCSQTTCINMTVFTRIICILLREFTVNVLPQGESNIRYCFILIIYLYKFDICLYESISKGVFLNRPSFAYNKQQRIF